MAVAEPLSPRNPRLAEVRSLLGSGSARRDRKRFVVEGPRLLAEALAASWSVVEVFAEDGDAWPGATLVRPGTLDRLGDAVTSQGVLAVVAAPPLLLSDLRPPPDALVLVLVDVADPGNAGTIMRSGLAAGAAALVLAGQCVDPLAPKVVRASAGSLFRLPLATTSVAELFSWAATVGMTVWASAPIGHPRAVDLYQTELEGAVALLFGSEARGLDDAVLERVGSRVLAVPTAAGVESLNVAMAATVVSFELLRRRRSVHAVAPATTGRTAQSGRLDAPVGGGQASGHDR